MSSYRTVYWGVLYLLALAFCGCESATESADEEARIIDEEARIIFGQSIDGVELGDSFAVVIEKLGEPSSIVLGACAWDIFEYGENDSLYMELVVMDDPQLGVCAFSVAYLYDGKSADNIGIGSSRDDALDYLGQPDSSASAATGIADYYMFTSNQFIIHYAGDSTITTIVMAGDDCAAILAEDPESRPVQYCVKTVDGETIEEYAEARADNPTSVWPQIIELDSTSTDSVFSGRVKLANQDWLEIESSNFRGEYFFFVMTIGVEPTEHVTFSSVVYDETSMTGDLCIGGRTLDCGGFPFTAQVE